MDDRYDVVIIGAGIGGLAAAGVLSKEGRKVLVLDREDRPGGRALSIEGSEVSERGSDWYRDVLGRHYCYLADSRPDIESVVSERLLDGYTLDLGYHGVGCAGLGYFGRLTEYLGIEVEVNPCDTGLYYAGEFYREPTLGKGKLDDRIYEACKRTGIKYWSFITSAFGKTPQELAELEQVSLYDYCKDLGVDDLIWQSYRCLGTLFTTINNPHDISAGEIIRFATNIMMPIIASGKPLHVGGFAVGGIGNWSAAVAAEVERLGGDIELGVEVKRVVTAGGEVEGVEMVMPTGETARVAANAVVSTVPIQETFELVPAEDFPAEFVSRVRSLYGYGSLAPYFWLNELPIPEEQAELLVKTPVVVEAGDDYDYDVYMCWNVQSAIDPSCAPPGKHLVTAYLPLTEEESHDRRKVAKVVEAVPEFLERAYPGFSECVDWALYPMCWKLEGVAKSISQAGTLKPEVEAPGLAWLYFAGDTARGFGVAMDCACSSGINCAAAILGRTLGIE